MRILAALLITCCLYGAAPTVTELRPRGAQKGRPFKLTLVGTNLGEGVAILSTLPATFTPIGLDKTDMENKATAFLVEPTEEWAVGVYPIRAKAPNGISNILLFTVGAFPEIVEEESREGSLPHQNDSIERAQTIPSTALTLNGTLKGPERDFYRLQVKAGERRVIEVEARRCGSAIDPVIRVLDGAGKLVAQSEDDPALSLDARLVMTFPKEGFYYVEVHDARFSTQAQDFYRLKTGSYDYVSEIFPLGGRRGEHVDVTVGASRVKVNLASVKTPQTFVNLPDSPALPLPFAVGDYPEVQESLAAVEQLPITINGRLSKPGEIDRYELRTKPGEPLMLSLQARELGTSKIMGLITVVDEKGNKLASAGDGPLPVDVAAVQVSSRTQGDPNLSFQVPAGVQKVIVTVEDLARRGGAFYAYRLSIYKAPFDLQATVTTPFVNIPSGGTALVNVNVERQGYLGPIRVEATKVPKGVIVAGGDIPAEIPDPNNRATSRRAMLSFTGEPGATFDFDEISLRAVASSDAGEKVVRNAVGVGYAIPVAGATAQGVVDRQRPLTGLWLGHSLPGATTDPTPATLGLQLEKSAKKEVGYEFQFRWKWAVKSAAQSVPDEVSAEVPNFIDLRVIEMKVDPNDKTSGTFLVTSTKNTLPAVYNIMVAGRLRENGLPIDVVSPVITFTVPVQSPEEKTANASSSAAR